MEHVDGLVIDDMGTARSTPHEVRRVAGLEMATTLAAIHEVDLERAGLGSLASHSSYAQRQLRRWSTQLDQSRTGATPEIDNLTERLRAAAPEHEELTLVHGDFHVRNVILAPTSGTVRAVLDWELATLGDPLADVGTLLAYWPQPGDRETPIFQAPALPGFVSRRELVDQYVTESGRDALIPGVLACPGSVEGRHHHAGRPSPDVGRATQSGPGCPGARGIRREHRAPRPGRGR